MFNQHTKFEVSTITCNEEMNGNAKFKNFRFEPTLWGTWGQRTGFICDSMESTLPTSY